MDFAFDRFINSKESKSKPFEVAQYRTSIQGVFNLNSLVKPKNEILIQGKNIATIPMQAVIKINFL